MTNDQDRNQNSTACPNCEGESFEWGKVRGKFDLKFRRDDANLLEKLTVFGGEAVRARRCLGCGNLQFFAHRS